MRKNLLPALALLVAAPVARAQPWEELAGSARDGGVSASTAFAVSPSVALDSSGFPVVAYDDGHRIYVKRWNGSGWGSFGGSAEAGGISGSNAIMPTIVLDPEDRPIVAWSSAYLGNRRIVLKRWDGSAWIAMGGSDSTYGIAGIGPTRSWFPKLVLDPGGRPVVAWIERDLGLENPMGDDQVWLRRWDGSEWVELGGSATGEGLSASEGLCINLAVAVDSAGAPTVAWEEYSFSGYRVRLRRWDEPGQVWTGLGGSDGVAWTVGHEPALAVDSQGRALLAFRAWRLDLTSPNIIFRRWTGASWEGLGGSDDVGLDRGETPCLAVNRLDEPVLAWRHIPLPGSGGYQIFLRAWNGEEWAERSLSATGAGLSQSPFVDTSSVGAIEPSLAFRDGHAAVAWTERSDAVGYHDVWLRLSTNQAPVIESLSQFKRDGITPLPHGGLTDGQRGFVARIAGADPSQTDISLQLQVQRVGVPFQDLMPSWWSGALPSGAEARIEMDGLDLGARYRWRVRAVDRDGAASAWVDYGSDSADETDFWVRTNMAPDLSVPEQIDPSTGRRIPDGGRFFSVGEVILAGRPSDFDQDGTTVQFLLGPDLGAAPDPPDDSTVPGNPIAVSLEPDGSVRGRIGILSGPYRWWCRAVDDFGATSGWTEGGRFEAVSMGSLGQRMVCGQSAGGGMALAWPLAALAWIALRRRHWHS